MSNLIIITLDASQMKTFLECEQKWVLSYVESLRFHRHSMIYLNKGTFVHKLLEVYYNFRVLNPRESTFATQNKVIEVFKSGKLYKASGLDKDTEKFIVDRFRQYCMRWMAYDFVPSKRNGVVGVELGFSKVLDRTEDYVFIVEGKIDLLSKTQHGYDCFIDNKSQERLQNLYPFKPQFLTYSWATGFRWGIINYFRLAQQYDPKETFKREMVFYEDWVIEKWEHQMMNIFRTIYHNIKNLRRLTDGYPNLTQDTVKDWMFRPNLGACGGAFEKHPCPYVMIHENDMKYHDALKQTYYFKVPKWSPWSTEEQESEVVA